MKEEIYSFINALDLSTLSEDDKIQKVITTFSEQDLIDSMNNEYANLYVQGILTSVEAIRYTVVNC
jgi:3-oxoacyl-ACP reductase-like protein